MFAPIALISFFWKETSGNIIGCLFDSPKGYSNSWISKKGLEEYDALFAEWRAKNPDGRFSQFSARRVERALEKGTRHQAIGPNLLRDVDWWEDGLALVEEIRAACSLLPDDKICDYGCGSLRIGAHFIKSQPKYCFFGLEVSDEFIRHGIELVGPGLIAQKQPELGNIDARMDDAVAFDADLLYSTDVASHVHPDEKNIYFRNILRIAHKPGAHVVILAILASSNVRYQRSGWAWTLDRYVEGMRPMSLIRTHKRKTIQRNGIALDSVMLTFRRLLSGP